MAERHTKTERFVSSGRKAGRAPFNMPLVTLLESIGRDDLTRQGFRSIFRDWCVEATNTLRELAEATLAHTLKDKVGACSKTWIFNHAAGLHSRTDNFNNHAHTPSGERQNDVVYQIAYHVVRLMLGHSDP